jgi:hypothetical protein
MADEIGRTQIECQRRTGLSANGNQVAVNMRKTKTNRIAQKQEIETLVLQRHGEEK